MAGGADHPQGRPCCCVWANRASQDWRMSSFASDRSRRSAWRSASIVTPHVHVPTRPPRARRLALGFIAVALRASIPDGCLIHLDAVLAEQAAVLRHERHFAVVLLLVRDVPANDLDVGLADGERPV